MSIQALSWALNQDVKPSALKFIFVTLCNYANEQGECWASASTLSKNTGLNIKTVEKWVKTLESTGWISDTGERRGNTKSIKIYKIVAFQPHPKLGVLRSSPKIGVEAPPILEGSSPNFGNPPAPPIKNNLNEPKGTIRQKSKEVTLQEWEKNLGCELCIQQMQNWVNAENLNPDQVKDLIKEFREEMTGKGKIYVDFIATFKVWLRKGYLSKTIEQVKKIEVRRGAAIIHDKGVSL